MSTPDTTDTARDTAPDAGAGRSLAPAKSPRGTGASPLVGQLVAVALIALGVVAVQEAVARVGLVSGPSWTSQVLSWADDRGVPPWFLPVGVIAVLLGLLLLPVAFRRRPRGTLTVQAQTGVFLRTGDLARLVRGSVEGLDGATGTDITATRRRLDVRVDTIASQEANAGLRTEVEDRVASTLQHLDDAPRVRVRIRNEDFT